MNGPEEQSPEKELLALRAEVEHLRLRETQLKQTEKRLQSTLNELYRHQDELRIQRDLSTSLSAVSDLDRALEICIEAALQVSGLNGAAIYLAGLDNRLDLAASWGLSSEFTQKESRLTCTPEYCGFMKDGPVYGREKDLPPAFKDHMIWEGVKGFAAIPLLHEGRIIGLFILTSHFINLITHPARVAIEAIAAQIGSAIVRIKAENELRKLESQYRLVVENANEAIMIVQDDLIRFINRRAILLSGHQRAELIGQPLLEYIHIEDRDLVSNIYQHVLNGYKPPSKIAFRWPTKTGADLWFETEPTQITWEDRPAVLILATDVTDRKLTEEALRESEEHFRSLMENARDFVVYRLAFEPDFTGMGRVVFVSPSITDILGARDPMDLSTWFDNIHPEDLDRILSAHFQGLESEKFQEEFKVYVPSRNHWRWVQVITRAVASRTGGPVFANGIILDITDRKKAEDAVLESEEHLRSLMENARDFVVYRLARYEGTDHGLKVVFVSPSIKEVMGVTDSSDFGAWFSNIHPDDLERIVKANEKAFKTNRFNEAMRVFHPEKAQWRWVQAIATGIADETGQVTYTNGIILDITDRVRAEEALMESQNTAMTLLNATTDMMFLFDTEDRLLAINEHAAQMLGRPIKSLINKKGIQLMPPDTSELWASKVYDVIRDGRMVKWKEERNGRHLSHSLHPVPDDQGHVVRLALLTRDRTERRRTEKEIQSYQSRLRRMGSELLLTEERERRRIANDLHDHIGQSLALSKLKLKSLREAVGSNDLGKVLDEICSLVEDMILETRSLTLELSPPILYELGLEAALEWLTEQIEKKYGLKTSFIDHGQPITIDDDIRVLLFRAARELLMNVVKHAQATCAVVSISLENDFIRIEVEDDGQGFDPADIRPHSPEHTGFGLFSIRERLNPVGGRLEIKTGAGNHTVATLIAPRGNAREPHVEINNEIEDNTGRRP